MSVSDLLLFDCGNSNVNAAISRKGKFPESSLSFDHKKSNFKDKLASYIRKNEVFKAVFVSVVPGVSQLLLSVLESEGVACCEFDPDICGVSSLYINPGSDRILFAYTVKNMYPGRAACLIDAGTALTVDGLDSEGVFTGGYIMPGFKTAFGSLGKSAPLLSNKELFVSYSPGTNTESSIGSGFSVLYSGGLRTAVDNILALSGESADIYLTGGDGSVVKELLPGYLLVYDPLLLLKGLVIYYHDCL